MNITIVICRDWINKGKIDIGKNWNTVNRLNSIIPLIKTKLSNFILWRVNRIITTATMFNIITENVNAQNTAILLYGLV